MKVGCVIIARNEEKTLRATLNSLYGQGLDRIVLVNDCSTDNTKKIATYFGVDVIDFPYTHEDWVISEKLGKVFNLGFETLGFYDYVLIMGADHILPPDYVSELISAMKNDNVVVASGIIDGDKANSVRGSGRIILGEFFKLLDYKYPENYGYESYILYKAHQLGFKTKTYPIITKTQRKTGINYGFKKYYHRGQALNALGYYFPFFLGVALKSEFKKIGSGFCLIAGYFNCKFEYEPKLRNTTKQMQKQRIKTRLSQFFMLNVFKNK